MPDVADGDTKTFFDPSLRWGAFDDPPRITKKLVGRPPPISKKEKCETVLLVKGSNILS
jgi:hypothetical protein